jgi:hypothetical protein
LREFDVVRGRVWGYEVEEPPHRDAGGARRGLRESEWGRETRARAPYRARQRVPTASPIGEATGLSRPGYL